VEDFVTRGIKQTACPQRARSCVERDRPLPDGRRVGFVRFSTPMPPHRPGPAGRGHRVARGRHARRL